MKIDFLEVTLKCLTATELKKNRVKIKAKSDMLARLFDALTAPKEFDESEFRKKYYSAEEDNSYYKARQRLSDCLIESIEDIMEIKDHSGETQFARHMTLARFYLNRHASEIACHFLNKALDIAGNAHRFDWSNSVYLLQMEYCDVLNLDGSLVYDKYQDNKRQQLLMENQLVIAAKTKNKLNAQNNPQGINTVQVIERIFQEIGVPKGAFYNPVFATRMAILCRSVIASGKDYLLFLPHLLATYWKLKNNNKFVGYCKHLEVDFLYFLSHTYYRVFNFEESRAWLNKLMNLQPIEDFRKSPFYYKAITLSAALDFCTNNLPNAIKILDEALNEPGALIPVKIRNKMRINLAVYHFYNEDFRTCRKHLLILPTKSKKQVDLMGDEWFFKWDLIEVILLRELDHTELSKRKLNTLNTKFEEMLQEKPYKRAGVFIGFISEYLENPRTAITTDFAERVLAAKLKLDGQAEDIQAILFFCWLRSKMKRRPCYEIFLERIAEGIEEVGHELKAS